MIRIFSAGENEIRKIPDADALQLMDLSRVIWVDSQNIAAEELQTIERTFSVLFQTAQQSEEIESRTRFSEEPDTIIAKSNILVQ
jgi:magnesium transporter